MQTFSKHVKEQQGKSFDFSVMTSIQKKKEFNDFAAFSFCLWGEKIDFDQPEPPKPDITFVLNSKIIGCELTTIFTDNIPGTSYSNSKKSESIQDWICNSLQDWLLKNIPVFLEIHVGFKNTSIDGSQKLTLRENIQKVIEADISDLNLSELSYIIIDNYEVLPREVDYISLTYFPNLNTTYVTRAGGGFIPKLTNERLHLNIQNKEKKLLRYSSLVEGSWLLLIIQDYLFSSEFDLIDGEYNTIDSKFDKIYLFLRRDKKVVVLK